MFPCSYTDPLELCVLGRQKVLTDIRPLSHRLPAKTLKGFWDKVLLLWSQISGEARPGGHGLGQAPGTSKARMGTGFDVCKPSRLWEWNWVYRLLQMGPL